MDVTIERKFLSRRGKVLLAINNFKYEKRKAEEDLFTKPNKLIRKELRELNTRVNSEHADFKRWRESMYTARRKLVPSVPRSREHAIDQLKDIDVSFNGEKFCYVGEDNIPLFTTPSNLKILAHSEHVIADGTFSYAPKHFYQMYTVHVHVNGFHIPVIYAFLPGKTTAMYVSFWMNVKALTLALVKLHFRCSTFHVDFEKAAHLAIMECFPDANIYGCTFHLNQAWYRRIKGNKQLRTHFRKKDTEGIWLKSFFALCFLPPDLVYNAFTSLMMDAPLITSEFTYYVLTTYIEDGCSFPPHLWASSPPNNFLRTTNGAESFHSDFNRQFYSAHPNIHVVVEVLKEIQGETELKKFSVNKGAVNPMKKSTSDMLDKLDTMWRSYVTDQNIKKYLEDVSQRYKSNVVTSADSDEE